MKYGDMREDGRGGLEFWDDSQWLPCNCGPCQISRQNTGAMGGFSAAISSSVVGLGSIDAVTVFTSSGIAQAPRPALTPADIQHAATEGRNTERDRMLARLMSMEPSREPYSKPQSEWGRREARRLWERMRDAIVDGKEAHKDRDALE